MSRSEPHRPDREGAPLVALTLGDVAGIGPEVVARAVTGDDVRQWCRPIVVGDPLILRRACDLVSRGAEVVEVSAVQAAAAPPVETPTPRIFCWNPTSADLRAVLPGRISPAAGQAAYDWLIAATGEALAGRVDAVVTAPLNKAALHAAGRRYPGHTEILAEQCGTADFAMMLYLPSGAPVQGPSGLGVAHVTLHTSIASVPGLLTTQAIREKIGLVDSFLRGIGSPRPRIGVCALNPHAGEGGLFGDEERRLIRPAVDSAREAGLDAAGPFPADTLLHRAVGGAYDGVVAMYHDQGHIALKLIGFQRAVNVTLGLPIVRTSPSHGTAFDIAWQGIADDSGIREAIRVAVKLNTRR